MQNVLFVCLGNICRSPAAEGVFLSKIQEKGLENEFKVDSAGTSAYHIGEPADQRMGRAASKRGIALPSRARQFKREDFDEFDHILVMDHDNYEDVTRLTDDPEKIRKVRMLREYDGDNGRTGSVPDPYFGGSDGFEEVLDILDHSVENLIESLRHQS